MHSFTFHISSFPSSILLYFFSWESDVSQGKIDISLVNTGSKKFRLGSSTFFAGPALRSNMVDHAHYTIWERRKQTCLLRFGSTDGFFFLSFGCFFYAKKKFGSVLHKSCYGQKLLRFNYLYSETYTT